MAEDTLAFVMEANLEDRLNISTRMNPTSHDEYRYSKMESTNFGKNRYRKMEPTNHDEYRYSKM